MGDTKEYDDFFKGIFFATVGPSGNLYYSFFDDKHNGVFLRDHIKEMSLAFFFPIGWLLYRKLYTPVLFFPILYSLIYFFKYTERLIIQDAEIYSFFYILHEFIKASPLLTISFVVYVCYPLLAARRARDFIQNSSSSTEALEKARLKGGVSVFGLVLGAIIDYLALRMTVFSGI